MKTLFCHESTALAAGAHRLSTLFTHYLLTTPTEITSSLHKIQITGEWRDLKRVMDDVTDRPCSALKARAPRTYLSDTQ